MTLADRPVVIEDYAGSQKYINHPQGGKNRRRCQFRAGSLIWSWPFADLVAIAKRRRASGRCPQNPPSRYHSAEALLVALRNAEAGSWDSTVPLRS